MLVLSLSFLFFIPFVSGSQASAAKQTLKMNPLPQEIGILGKGFPLTSVVGLVIGENTDEAAVREVEQALPNNRAKVANATELPMMEMSDGHYVGYWTAPDGATADGAVIEVKVVDDFKNETRQGAEGNLFINVDE